MGRRDRIGELDDDLREAPHRNHLLGETMRHIAFGMAFLLLGSGPALAGQCEARKLKVVANTTVKLAACLAKAVNKGLPLDSTSTCLADTDEITRKADECVKAGEHRRAHSHGGGLLATDPGH